MSTWKPGMKFEHARYIIGSPKAKTARPDICTVTRVVKGMVYYHTENGMKMMSRVVNFDSIVLKRLL